MTVTADQLRAQVNTTESQLDDDAAELLLAVALALVEKHVLGDDSDDELTDVVPPEVVDRAVLLVAAEEFAQDSAPNGIVNQAFSDALGDAASTPIRVSRDPMKPAYPILAPWASGRFFCA